MNHDDRAPSQVPAHLLGMTISKRVQRTTVILRAYCATKALEWAHDRRPGAPTHPATGRPGIGALLEVVLAVLGHPL